MCLDNKIGNGREEKEEKGEGKEREGGGELYLPSKSPILEEYSTY